MDKYSLLDCTLRDGGYITDWQFGETAIRKMLEGLAGAGIDYVEAGYLNRKKYRDGSSVFQSIEQISIFLPKERGTCSFLAMADVEQFFPEDITEFSGNSIDGIRIVFYKHQINNAYHLAEAAAKAGYKLFVQPMVTIDYSIDEYASVIKLFAGLDPYAVSIVDSFGYMTKSDFRQYFKVVDNLLAPDAAIGFHSHNNMKLAFLTAQDAFDYDTQRKMIIDSSLYGMGRGAGNLHTELIANYYNVTLGKKYDCIKILGLISGYIMPIAQNHRWGYSPYLFLTGLKHCHPNFACYLLDEYPEVSVSQFEKYLNTIPSEMKTRCRKDYVLEMWDIYSGSQLTNDKDYFGI